MLAEYHSLLAASALGLYISWGFYLRSHGLHLLDNRFVVELLATHASHIVGRLVELLLGHFFLMFLSQLTSFVLALLLLLFVDFLVSRVHF